MNLKCSPPSSYPDSATASSDESDVHDDKMTAIENKEKDSPCTRHLNLFILVFLAGVFAASGVALFTSAYLGNKSFSSTSSESEGQFLTFHQHFNEYIIISIYLGWFSFFPFPLYHVRL